MQKQAVKRIRTRKSYRTYWAFLFYPNKWKKIAIYLQEVAIFNIYHVFAPFVKLRGSRFLCFFSLCDLRNEAVVLLLEHSSLKGVKKKKHEKKTWKVAGMETTIFANFDPTLTQILAWKDPNKEFLKEHFSQEKQKLHYYQFYDFNTD